jgi:hypothetical protein
MSARTQKPKAHFVTLHFSLVAKLELQLLLHVNTNSDFFLFCVLRFAERCCELLSGHCSASDVVAVWSGLFGQGCLAVSAHIANVT